MRDVTIFAAVVVVAGVVADVALVVCFGVLGEREVLSFCGETGEEGREEEDEEEDEEEGRLLS